MFGGGNGKAERGHAVVKWKVIGKRYIIWKFERVGRINSLNEGGKRIVKNRPLLSKWKFRTRIRV